jgi:hypothetical protein
MTTTTRLLLICAALTAGSHLLTAQDGKKMRNAHPGIANVYADNCAPCDSLAHAYLDAGDTSMALYYFSQYLEGRDNEFDRKQSVNQLRSRYLNTKKSFYHIDY